jgi:ATP-binding protein involved in chromosome partitioning
MATESDVRNALAKVQDPELNQSIVELGMVRDLRITDGRVVFTLALTTLGCPFKDRIVGDARQAGFCLWTSPRNRKKTATKSP